MIEARGKEDGGAAAGAGFRMRKFQESVETITAMESKEACARPETSPSSGNTIPDENMPPIPMAKRIAAAAPHRRKEPTMPSPAAAPNNGSDSHC